MSAPAVSNANLVQNMIRDRLEEKLSDEFYVYARRDFTVLPADEFPAVYVVMQAEIFLEEETDNRDLIGYPAGVVIMFKSAQLERDQQNPLLEVRRLAQQAVYTTNWPAAAAAGGVEQVVLDETLAADLPGDLEGVSPTGFTIVIGLIEEREK